MHVAGIVILYIVVTLPSLLNYPGLWVDEGWIAEAALQFSRGLPLGNPSHSELYRYSDRIFWMPHLYFVGLGGWFSLWGDSLLSARCFSLLLGCATTLVLFSLLVCGLGTRPAFWATLALLTDTFVWKSHRTVRFEPAVTLLALLAAAAGLRALARRREGRDDTGAWIGAGVALAAMANVHPNALFMALSLGVYLIVDGGLSLLRRRGPWLALLLVLLGILPFVAYLLSDQAAGFVNLVGQNSFHFEDHGVAGWPPALEFARYAAYFPAPARLPAALLWLAVLALAAWRARTDRRLRAPLAALATLLVGLAFLPNKSLLYLTAAVPLAAALLATLMSDERGVPTSTRVARMASAIAVLLVLANLAVDAALIRRNAGTDPQRLLATVAAELRPGDRVAGTFVTWWAAVDHPFREFQRVRSVADLEAFHPTVVIVGDRHWEGARDSVFRVLAPEVEAWLARSGTPPRVVADPVLGTLRIYRLQPAP